MAPGFAFPPPPPPPPKRQQDNTAPYASQGRGFSSAARGRGRGEIHATSANALPTGTYVNPNFQPLQRHAPNGQQHDTSKSTQRARGYAASTYPDRSTAGHKRKLDVLRGGPPAQASRSRPDIAPSVPSFGAPLTSETAARTAAEPTRKPVKSLFGSGVTQDEPEYSDSDDAQEDAEDDDADEEAAYAQLGNKLVFEHEGQIIKLTSEQDLVRWQAERRKKFPTTDRVAVKEAQRRVTGDERKRLLSAAYMLRRPDWRAAIDRLGIVETQDEVELPASSANSAATVAKTSGLGLGAYDSDDDDEDAASTSKVEGQEAEGSDDEPPEAISSKTIEPPDNRPACKFFFANGRCKEGESCSYRHEARPDQPLDLQSQHKREKPKRIIVKDKSKKRGIHQVLVDQENAAGDKLALQVIKYLGSIGFFTPTD